jgi:hypothetical protein
MRVTRNAYRCSVEKLLGIFPFENIKMDVININCEFGRWVELVQGRVQWRVLKLRVLLQQCYWG